MHRAVRAWSYTEQGTISSAHTLASQNEIGQIVYEYFAIPKEFTEDAVNGLEQLEDPWT
jgi:hypothetical protein